MQYVDLVFEIYISKRLSPTIFNLFNLFFYYSKTWAAVASVKYSIILTNSSTISKFIWLASTYLVIDDNVIFSGHVIGDIVIHDQPEQPIEECQVNLLIQFLKARFE